MNRQRIRDRAAAAALRAARRVGVEIEFKNPSDPFVSFWGYVVGNNRTIGLLGGLTDMDELEVVIPRQTNFPPAAFNPGAEIRYPKTSGNVFAVEDAIGDNEDINQSSTFRLSCRRFAHCTVENED